MVWYAGSRSPICILHAVMTLTNPRSRWWGLPIRLYVQKLNFSMHISTILACSSKLMVDYDSTGPSLQLFIARFLNFFSVSYHMTSNFTECRYNRTFKGHISVLLEARVTWLGMLVVLYLLCLLIWPWPDPRSRWRSWRWLHLILGPFIDTSGHW